MKQKNFLTALICFFLTVNFFAADVYVSSSGNDTAGDGSLGNPYLTIDKAVTEAIAGDTIIITGTVTQTGEVNLGKNLTFKGQSNATVEGDTTNRLFNVSNPSITLSFSDITFQNITSSIQGAVLNTTQPTLNLTVTNCNFLNNTTTVTGGVFYIGNSSTTTITGCTFYNNKGGSQGGAIKFDGSTNATITNCTFYKNNNTVGNNFSGGAIRVNNNGNIINISNSLFYDNYSNNGGSDIASDVNTLPGATVNITNSLAEFTNNIDLPTTGSNLTADFTNTTFSFVSPNLTYTAPNSLVDDTPIDFGSDSKDVGAWDSNINIFEGTDSESWSLSTNWSSGSVPVKDGSENIAILTGKNCNMFENGVVVNSIKVTSELRIQNQRVFLVNGESDVTGIVRYFTDLQNDVDNTKAWYLVSSPLSGEIFDSAFIDRNDITAGTGSTKALATYNPGLTGNDAWTYFTGSDINATSGQGFSMKITPDGVTFADGGGEYANNAIGFEGNFNTNNAGVTTNTSITGFNLLGNPYVAYVNSATFLGAATSSNIDQTQIWVWNQATDMYEVKVSGDAFILAPTQGFFVNVNTAGSVNFAESNQATTGGVFQKTSKTEVKLLMSNGESNRFAKIYYSENTTKGFDYGWEGETFGGIINSFAVFSQLVEDNQGKNYQVQSLPILEMESITVPLGIRAAANKEITFSGEALNLPSDVKVFLEDRVTNTFTQLDEANTTYKVTLTENANGTGRFYLHTKTSAVLSTDDIALNNTSIYTTTNNTIRLVGLPSGTANLKVFNVLGKQVMQTSFSSIGVKEISLPKLSTGMYIIQLETADYKLNKKIIIE